jgi:hypothetical protein
MVLPPRIAAHRIAVARLAMLSPISRRVACLLHELSSKVNLTSPRDPSAPTHVLARPPETPLPSIVVRRCRRVRAGARRRERVCGRV